jgi:hypothetical protein
VLLGASNLVRGLTTVVDAARHAWGGPLDLLAAMGHGRSYGTESRVLGRSLPGILSCGLWKDLAGRRSAPTAALVTDIGNDILFGAAPGQIARWVERSLQRLGDISSRVVITELPLESLQQLGPRRFLFMRTILFPKSRLTLPLALDHAAELNQRVRELSRRYDACLVKPCSSWFGFDPIHVRRGRQESAWRTVFSGWQDAEQPMRQRASFRDRLMLRLLRPQHRRLFGIEQSRSQPAGILSDGTVVSLY